MHNGHRAIRQGNWKLVSLKDSPWELYDLAADPHELQNVYDDPANRPIIDRLKTQLLALKDQYGDKDEIYPELMRLRETQWNP